MDTLILINRLTDICANHPDSLQSFDWNDLYECVEAELRYRQEFYPSPAYEVLTARVHDLTDTAAKALHFRDYFGVQKNLAEISGITEALPVGNEHSAFSQQAAFDHAALSHYRNDSTVIIGDSHVNFFSGNEIINYNYVGHDIALCPQNNDLNFTVLYLGPCLAYTCMKSNSTAGFYNKLDYLKKNFLHPSARIVLSLGEIDIRTHVFRQAELQNSDFQNILKEIASHYRCLIRELIAAGYQVYCWGPIGTQKDSIPEDPAFPRYGSEYDRNSATEYFNTLMSEACKEEGAVFLSIFSQLVDENRMTKEKYLSPDHFHIGQSAMELALPAFQSAGIL